MSDPFESPKLLIDRAKEHARHFEMEVSAFVNKRPYTHLVEREPDTGQYAHKWKVTENVPNRLRTVAFDIGNSLRSALDQAVYGSCIALKVNPLKSYKFPFGDTVDDVENDIRRGCRDVPTDILALLRAFKPYQGGNGPLWALNKMRNTKDHKVLVPIGFVPGGVSMKLDSVRLSGSFSLGMHRWDAAKNELTYALTDRPDTLEGQYSVQIAVTIALGDIPVLSGQPAVAVFNHLCGEVERIVLGIEAETLRLVAVRGP